jgi:hypothetical protein
MLCDVVPTFSLIAVPVNTLECMPSDSASPEQPGRAATGGGEQAEEARPAERYGPVEVARHAKDDGRALLLYTAVDAGET